MNLRLVVSDWLRRISRVRVHEFGEIKMEIGKRYNVAFSTGRYEIGYENNVTCIKKTPTSYRVKRTDGTTRLIGHDSIFDLKEIRGLAEP